MGVTAVAARTSLYMHVRLCFHVKMFANVPERLD